MRQVLLAVLALLGSSQLTLAADAWPSFRGEFARGVVDGQALPVRWDPSTGLNVRWHAKLPGASHSSPIVWGELAYVVTAVSDGETELVLGDAGGISLAGDREKTFSWRLYAFDTASGEIAWQREAYAGTPRAGRHVRIEPGQRDAGYRRGDGRRHLRFAGDGGLRHRRRRALAGRPGSARSGLFGDSSSHWGHASSPVIHEGRVFVQVDRHSGSFVAAYDLATGETLWKVDRDEKPVWATPTIHQTADRTQLIVIGGDFDRGLDPASGRELWRFARDLEVKTPTPFVAGERIVLSGGYRGKELFAVAVTAEGLVEESALAWKSAPGGPYTSTPVVYRERLFYVRDTGILHVLDPANGESLHRERLEGTYSASPVAGDGKVYLTGEDGVVRVVAAEEPFAQLAAVDMGAPCMATPAIADGTIYLRCGSTLWAVAEAESGDSEGGG